jgi:multidrug resistance efflux pump
MKSLYRRGRVFVPALLVGSLAMPAFAQDSNPYVHIYLKRWEIAKLQAQREAIELAYEERMLQRLQSLVARGVISRQQVEVQEINVQSARLRKENYEGKAAEAQALYAVNKLRVQNGLEVSVCPEGD